MHKLIKYIAWPTLICLFIYLGCDSSLLDEPKPQDPVEDDFFLTEQDFHLALIGMYASLTDYWWWNANNPAFPLWVLPDDQATTTGTTTAAVDFEAFSSLEPTNAASRDFYAACYKIIQRANTLIEKNAEAENIYVTAGLKNAHRGEALFVRSFIHFSLWNYYGIAPVVTRRNTSIDQTFIGPSAGTDLLTQCITDLQEAATLLPASWDADNLGRITRNAAYGMLGKVLVFRGTVEGTTADFTSAINAFNAISGVSLVPNWTDNFAFDAENNAESLFEFQASRSAVENIWLNNDFGTVNGNMSTAGYTGFIANNQSASYGGRIKATQKMVDALAPNDPRTAYTLDADQRYVIKFALRSGPLPRNITSIDNPRVMRYAEVLLLKAEATLRAGAALTDAIGYINEVRTRARNFGGGSFPEDLNTSETNPDLVMQWIRNEKLIELAFEEGHRWWDLRRWAMINEITLDDAFFDSDNTNFDFTYPKHLYYPIPQTELNRNNKMTQNEGY